jgi:hypothetical protein
MTLAATIQFALSQLSLGVTVELIMLPYPILSANGVHFVALLTCTSHYNSFHYIVLLTAVMHVTASFFLHINYLVYNSH